MYKDKDKQREAGRERQRRYKERHKGVTSEGVTDKALPTTIACPVVDVFGLAVITKPKRGKDIKCFEDLSDAAKHRVDNLVSAGIVRPTEVYGKPGDANYNGICTEAWRAERGR